MFSIGICDDDIHMLTYLDKLCQKILPECKVEAYQSGSELLKSQTNFDVILVDIKMEGADGLETVRKLRGDTVDSCTRRPAVVFITAYDEYVFEALDLFAFQYLLKPLDEKKFEKVLLTAASECPRQTEEALTFHTKSSHFRIIPSRIIYIESNLRKVIIHTEKEAVEIYATMAELEQRLDSRFYRCHRGYLVNFEKIEKYDRKSIVLSDGTNLILAKNRYTEFVDAYLNFLKRVYK
ncbi:LytR/AlgR family response regulator transcription factor [Hungatella hathewayi]|uniref:LytR/AlgR family response regulator transcription factor n=1 Tax=Hungatella hathewayi TaxID=154046 RepID=UPI003567A09C